MLIMIFISEVTPSHELSDKGKNKTNGLNYAGPGKNHIDWELTNQQDKFNILDPLQLQPEVSNSSDSPSSHYVVTLIIYLFLHWN